MEELNLFLGKEYFEDIKMSILEACLSFFIFSLMLMAIIFHFNSLFSFQIKNIKEVKYRENLKSFFDYLEDEVTNRGEIYTMDDFLSINSINNDLGFVIATKEDSKNYNYSAYEYRPGSSAILRWAKNQEVRKDQAPNEVRLSLSSPRYILKDVKSVEASYSKEKNYIRLDVSLGDRDIDVSESLILKIADANE